MHVRTTLAITSLLFLLSCDGGGRAAGWRATPEGDGPRVVWDLYAPELPEIPLPNDIATWPDPTSPTGRRINASQLVPTGLEALTRRYFDELDGWGTFAPISVQFEEHLDLEDLLERQGGMDHFREADFPEHAVYLIDMETGLPVPLDLNGGNFPYSAMHTDQYFENDPRSTESNILFETVEEDANGNGVLDPGEDTDFDGVLDHPNTLDGTLRGEPLETYDRMAWFYERETKTLIVRPIIPLRQRTTYAVVLTNRLVGLDGAPVRSPFDHVHHVRQAPTLEPLPGHLAAHPELYGSLATNGWDDVAFAWTFTTQSVTDDLDTIREGLYARGSMERLAEEFPADVVPMPMQGGRGCPDPGARTYVAPGDTFRTALRELGAGALGLTEEQAIMLAEAYSSLSHVVTVLLETPYFFGDPEDEQLEDAFQIDYQTGEARVNREVIAMTMFIPKEGEGRTQPFAPLLYMHGHGSNIGEVLAYGGLVLQHGNALVVLNAHGHGLEVETLERRLISSLFGSHCLLGSAEALMTGRARDLDGDGSLDSGVHFWTAYVFHTRDSVRQTIVDQLQAVRILRSFDGRTAGPRALAPPGGELLEFDGDYDGDGAPDVAGDFDGNGTPDLGGPESPYAMAGGSLGGIITGLMAGVEPAVTASAPVVGAGGLGDVAIRTENGSVLPAMLLRLMGPLVVSAPSDGGTRSSCEAGEIALAVIAPSLTDDIRMEIACLPASDVAADDALIVRNQTNGEVRCSGSIGGEAGRFRVGVPSDAGDRWVIEHYAHGRDRLDFGHCTFSGEPPEPDRVIATFEVEARFAETTYEAGAPLVSPAAGFGRRRQSPELRRLVMLAQIGLERGDPINYVRRVLLEPLTAPDVPERPRSMLVTHTDGDPNVPIATSYSMARAAGILPFLPPDAPPHLAEYRAPASFEETHPGFATPNDLLIAYHAIEGLPRLERHPVPGGGERFLADVDDLSDGRSFFASDGETQLSPDMGGLAPVTLSPPLRWSRRSRAMASQRDDTVWTYAAGEPTSGVVSPYVQPAGIHGFSEIYDDSLGFDMAVYMFNMLGRYLGTDGTDIPYLSDPDGHHCLEDSSCEYIRR